MSELKFWNGSAQFVKKEWEVMVICAYSIQDAIKLYVEVGGGERGAAGQVRDYMGRAMGTAASKAIPNPQRGVYFGSRDWKAMMYVEPLSRSEVEPVPPAAVEAASAQAVPTDYGRLRVGFSRGVKIDVWTYESPHADRAYADKMTAEVRLEPLRRASRAGEDGMIFSATSECWTEEITSPNIDSLFAKVQEAFRTYDLAQRGIVWEDWLEIIIQPETAFHRNEEGTSAGFILSYRIIKRGLDPRSGRPYTIHDHGHVSPFPKPKAAGEKEKGDKGDGFFHGRDEEHQYAYLPATPENRAALDTIIGKVGELRTRLAALLVQKHIGTELIRTANQMGEAKSLLVEHKVVSPSESG